MSRSRSVGTLVAAAALSVAGSAGAQTIAPVPINHVSVGGSFWSPRLEAVREGTLGANRHQCDITGRITNFERAGAKIAGAQEPGPYQGLLFNDSDVYKMMEGWAYLLATESDPARRTELDRDLDELIATITRAQHPDGYINTYYTLKAGMENRFTREEWDHETYCMGHLVEAGVAHFQATGKRTLLDVAIRSADYLDSLYGPDSFTAPPGHQELELALVRLADATGETRYLDLAEFLIEQRGRVHRKLDGTTYGPWGDYAQDHLPAREQTEAAGHAVRAGYMYSAMADLALHGRGDYIPALHALWEDVTERRIFVTGGIGPSASNEGFTQPYDIPTHSAYQETCASIALCMWAHRMFLLTGEASYMEQFERTLYNAVLAGSSLDGSKFFYVNPLASRGGHARRDWYDCACCPPNVLRFFASLGECVYAVKGDTIYLNLFMESSATLATSGGNVYIDQRTDYPFSGDVRILVKNPTDRPITLAVRSSGKSIVDGASGDNALNEDGYYHSRVDANSELELAWRVPMTPRRVYADPRVKESMGRVAIMRGPLVYAAESIDNAADVNALLLPPGAAFEEREVDGAPAIIASGFRALGDPSDGSLYRRGMALEPSPIVLRPYFMWANRGPSSLVVWLPESAQFMDPQPPKGVSISASYVGHGAGPLAMIDRIEPENSIDHSIPRFTFWPHKGVARSQSGSGPVAGADAEPAGREWIQLEFDQPRRLSECSIYWFDDTGRGQCRVPRAWTVEWRDGDAWRACTIENGSPGVERDAFNTARFTPVTASSLRIKIEMQEGMSTGVLELRAK